MSLGDARVLDIADETMTPNFSAANFKAAYAHYISVANKMIKKEGVLTLLEACYGCANDGDARDHSY